MNRLVLGLFDDQNNAEYAVDDLRDFGYEPENIWIFKKNGDLSKLDLPSEDLKIYEQHLNQGKILVALRAYEDEEDEIRMIFENHDASDVKISEGEVEEYDQPIEDMFKPAFLGTKGGKAKKGKTKKRVSKRKRETREIIDDEDL